MAKGQQRSNKEKKKPKQKKAASAPPSAFEKGRPASIGEGKKKP